MSLTENLASNATAGSPCNQLHNSARTGLCNRLQETGDHPCNPLHKPLDDRVAFYADAARSSATRRAYASDMAAFFAWGGRVPASPETVASYLAASACLAAATLRRRLAAIADAHQAIGHLDPTKHPLVRKVFRGIRRVHGARADASTPLDIDMLARIVAALPNDLIAIRDRALLLVGFFCALRRSELVALAVEDLDRRPDGWIITIQRSKTDPYGHGQLVPLPTFHGPLCPTAAIADWLEIAAIADGPVFRAVGSDHKIASTLPAAQVGLILRTRAIKAGLDVQRLSAHSLRSGFAVSATRAGIAAAQIQAVTRHRTLSGLAPYVRTAGPPSTAQLLGLPSLNTLALEEL
jgi:integrase